MKSIFLSLALLASQLSCAQIWTYYDCQDIPVNFGCWGGGVGATINPLTEPELFTIDTTDTGNLWVYGSSSKPFGSSQESVIGWTTDSISSYATGTRSEFVVSANYQQSRPVSWILFEHRYYSDSLMDGGYVEFSCDSLNWNKVFDQFSTGVEHPYQIITENYGPAHIGDSIPSFTGNSEGWQESYIVLHWYASAMHNDSYRTIVGCDWEGIAKHYYRFVFESDSIDNQKAGWQIRNIMIGGHNQIGSIHENQLKELEIHPNPAIDQIKITLQESQRPEYMAVYSVSGKQLLRRPFTESINISSLEPGLYLIMVRTKSYTYRTKFLKE